MVSLLVVEDDPDVAEWIVHCVSTSGREVRSVGTPAAAHELWALGYRADLVLLDYDLPGQTGVELWSELSERWPEARWLFVTVHWSGEVLRAIDSTGVERVAKPFDADALRAATERALVGGGTP